MTVTDQNGRTFAVRKNGEFDMRYKYSRELAKAEALENAKAKLREERIQKLRKETKVKKLNKKAGKTYFWSPRKNTDKFSALIGILFILALALLA